MAITFRALVVTPDGRHVVCASDDTTMRVWDPATGEDREFLHGKTIRAVAVAVTPDGRHVVSGSYDNTLRIWDLVGRDGEILLLGPSSGSYDNTLRVWDLATRETKMVLRGHANSVNAVAITPDGRHVISGSRDHTLRVWDLVTGGAETTFRGHTDWVNAVAVTPDGRHVVSASNDRTLRIWGLKDGKEIITFTLDGHVTTCIVAPDNRTIVAGDGFGRLHFLRIVEADETKPSIGDAKIPILHHKEQAC